MNFSDAVTCYRRLLCKGHLDELNEVASKLATYVNNPTSGNLHELAGGCVFGDHQRRISRTAKDTAVRTLESNLNGILSNHYTDFEELYTHVNSLIGGIDNIGLLTIYDVSLRIGHLLTPPIYPKDYLYLNKGAWDGARKLMGGKSPKNVMLFKDFFADKAVSRIVGIRDLQSLPNSLVEDFLCVMHNFLDVTPSGVISDRDTTSTYIQIKKYS